MEQIKIRLSNKLYNKEAILSALDDFRYVCTGKLVSDDFEVHITPSIKTEEPIEFEFCNYVLGLMKNKILV